MSINATGQMVNTRMDAKEVRRLEQEARAYNFGLGQKLGKEVGKENMGRDEFLKLLTTQLSHQDPLSPMDNKDFIAQMAQFSSLEQMLNVNTTLTDMKKSAGAQEAYNMLDKDVTYFNANDELVNGHVDSISITKEGTVNLQVRASAGHLQVSPEDVRAVKKATSAYENAQKSIQRTANYTENKTTTNGTVGFKEDGTTAIID